MKDRAAAGLLLLLLAGCGAAEPQITADPAPTPTAEPVKTAAPAETEEPELTWYDCHDVFQVETGGALGTLTVTVERGEASDQLLFAVWRSGGGEKLLQTMTAEYEGIFHWSQTVDANFDGHQDFGYMYAMGNQPTYWHFWLWDEEQGRFTAEPAFDMISEPQFDGGTETVSGYARNSAASGVQTYYRWEDGALVCVRRVECHVPAGQGEEETQLLTVEDWIGGALVEVFRETFGSPETGEIYEEAARWDDPDYHGEAQGGAGT